MGEEQLVKGVLYFMDDNGTEVEIGNLAETKLVNDSFKDEPKQSYFTACTDASVEFTVELDTANDFFKELVEENKKYQAMSLEERTLYHTGGKFDTIICPSEYIKQLLIEEFGELNYVVSNLATGVILV